MTKWRQRIVARLNRDLPIGTRVRYWPGARDEPARLGEIRSEWWEMPSGQIVAKVTGYAGGISHSHIEAEVSHG